MDGKVIVGVKVKVEVKVGARVRSAQWEFWHRGQDVRKAMGDTLKIVLETDHTH